MKSASVVAVLILALLGVGTASAATMTFVPSFSNSGLGGGATFAAALTFSGTEYHGEPSPLTKVTVHLPAGVGGTTSGFGTCTKQTLEEIGIRGCPPASIAGPVGPVGSIVFQVKVGPTPGEPPVIEEGTIQAVFSPEGQLYFFVEAHSPVSLELIFPGAYTTDSSPYSHALTIEIPKLETVPGAPLLSTTSMTLEFGASREEGGTTINSVIIPEECPSGGFAWAADSTFENASTDHLMATSVCPGFRAPPPSHSGPATAGPPPPPPPAPTGSISLASSTISVQKSGAAQVKLTCTGTATCSGELTLTAKSTTKKGKKKKTKTTTIGTAGFSIPTGSTATIKPTLNGAGKALLKTAHGHLNATLTIVKSSPSPALTNTYSVHLSQQKATKGKKKKK